MDEIFFSFVAHVALRDPHTGSVMSRAMSNVFQEYGNKWHIADFFTKVSKFQVNVCSNQSKANKTLENIFMRRLTLAMRT